MIIFAIHSITATKFKLLPVWWCSSSASD